MEGGAILLPVSTAVLPPAAPAGTPQQSIAVTAIRQALGASTVIPSTGVQRPAPAAVRLPMTMLTIRIATVRGFRTMRCGISVPRRARPAETLAMNTQTTPTPTVTASATIAVQLSA